jgi:hypothetical protein
LENAAIVVFVGIDLILAMVNGVFALSCVLTFVRLASGVSTWRLDVVFVIFSPCWPVSIAVLVSRSISRQVAASIAGYFTRRFPERISRKFLGALTFTIAFAKVFSRRSSRRLTGCVTSGFPKRISRKFL